MVNVTRFYVLSFLRNTQTESYRIYVPARPNKQEFASNLVSVKVISFITATKDSSNQISANAIGLIGYEL